jgi:8-oxo-dGTP pyrophosphatase MutT (NUDIX family)
MNKLIENFLATAAFLNGARADKAKADPAHRVPSSDPIHDLDLIENGGDTKSAYDATEAAQRLVKSQKEHEDLSSQYDSMSKGMDADELTPEKRSQLENLQTQITTKHHEIEHLKTQIEENNFGGRTERETPDHPMAEHFVNHSGTDDEEEMLKHKAREHLKGLQRESFAAEQELMQSGEDEEEAEAEVEGAVEGDDPDNPQQGKDPKKPAEKKDPAGKKAESKEAAGKDGKKAPKKDGKSGDKKDPDGKGDETDEEGEPTGKKSKEDLEKAIQIHKEFMQFIMKRFPDLLEKMDKQDLDGHSTKKKQQQEQAEQLAAQGEKAGAEQAAAGEAAAKSAKSEKDGDRKFEAGESQKQRDHEVKLERIKQSGKARADRRNPLTDGEGTVNADGLKVAAGILFVSRHGKVLMGLRAEMGAYQKHWGIFGGHHEAGETLEVTAIREVMEEAGYVVTDPKRLQSIATTVDGETEFTYFVYTVDEPFTPRLNHEHIDYQWVEFGSTPDSVCPMIPGFMEVLDSLPVRMIRRAKMTELDVIRAMRSGHLESGQAFYNMKLYKMRITGTGVSFRHGTAHQPDKAGRPDEFVMREPDAFLSQDFMERCNGIPVIFDHPEKAILNSKEFHDRIVGIMVAPWLENGEVWGIAKIYDDDTKTILDAKKMSTSPSVVFLDSDSTSTIALNDGSQIHIERVPTLLDHLAICEIGVWDKGQDPTGVESGSVVV